MKRYVDLSGRLENGLWDYRALPGLEKLITPVEIGTIATVERNDFFASRISLCTVSGTYLESGSHILPQGKNLDRYGVADFIRPARILRLPRQKAKAQIDAPLLAAHAPKGGVRKGEALLVDTGWGRNWNKPGYVLDCPNFTLAAVEWLVGRGISLVGFDVPCIEGAWSGDVSGEKGGLLGMLFRKGLLMAAPLVDLSKVRGDRGMLYCLPLPVVGTSGAPARVVFEEKV